MVSIFDTKSFLPSRDKICVHPVTGVNCGANDPTLWMDFESAKVFGSEVSFCVNTPFFAIDIDSCIPATGDQGELVKLILTKFGGAHVEVSRSGKGLHIFGRYSGERPLHKAKNTALKMEMYTSNRHIVLGTYKMGSSDVDCTNALDWLIENYFKPKAEESSAVPTKSTQDDKKIVSRMRKEGMGNSKAAKLLDMDGDELKEFYPGDGYSHIDYALINKIAFYTQDEEQIERIARTTKLYRDKWDDRPEYIPNTIKNVLSTLTATATTKVKPTPVLVDKIPEPTEEREGFQLMTLPAQKEHFKGCVYVASEDRILIPNGQLLNHSRFKAAYGGWVFALTSDNNKTTTNAWDCFTNSQNFNFPKVDDMAFDPFRATGEIFTQDGLSVVNTYREVKNIGKPGDPTPFLVHVRKLLPDDNDQKILLTWMACVLQNPWKKILWAPVIQGCEGNGKSVIVEVLQKSIGEKFSHTPNPKNIDNAFNAWLINKRLIIVNEINTRKNREKMEALKSLIADKRIGVTKKGVDENSSQNYASFLMTTNYLDAIAVDNDSRRYCMLSTAQQSLSDILRDGMTGDYFNNLFNWLGNGGFDICTDYLLNYPIDGNMHPLTTQQRAPESSTQSLAVEESETSLKSHLAALIDEQPVGLRGGWVSSTAIRKLLPNYHVKTILKILRKDFGFVNHPSLDEKSRPSRPSVIDGGAKPTLLIKKGKVLKIMDALDQYIEEQQQ